MTSTTPIIFLPATAGRPAEPAPWLLTEEEMIRLCRLDTNEDPYSALRRYRLKGQLKATQVGRSLRYQLPDALRFLESAREENPR